MKITFEINLESDEYRFTLMILYAELKRLTDLHDHAKAHGEFGYEDPRIETLMRLIDGIQYGQLDK